MKKNIILLYGPPGVGKLTVGQEIVKKTNFKLFHIHLLADLVKSIFDFGTKEFSETSTHLWLYLFEKALMNTRTGLVITLVYGVQTFEGKDDDAFFKEIVDVAEAHNDAIYFVKLTCSDEELANRVQCDSRKQFGKITSPDLLNKIRQKYNVDKKIPFVESIVIDTTDLRPAQVAEIIISKTIAS